MLLLVFTPNPVDTTNQILYWYAQNNRAATKETKLLQDSNSKF
jgi:hypothetical protein